MNEQKTGRYQATRRGYGFIIPDGGGEDWFVPSGDHGTAWDGDTVTYAPSGGVNRQGRKTAKITGVVTRARKVITGQLRKEGRLVYLAPDSDRLPPAILLSGKLTGASVGDKAAVAVLSYGTQKTPPQGALRETFGKSGTRQAATAAILYHYEIDSDFPPDVWQAAQDAPQSVPPDATEGRTDLRSTLTVTIDGATAKDLDDAVSLTRDDQGRLVLGVHIADVSHYVTHNSPLDREAFARGTSVYFADQVAPMLPPALSNGICSLNPQVDRLTLSCLITLDANHDVAHYTVCKSVICTAQRLNYQECNELLEGEPSPLPPEIQALVTGLDALAKARVKKRRNRGALLLESGECYFVCDQQGNPVDIAQRQSGPAESLIEECMLLANETVARHLVETQLPGVFRIHEKPSEDKSEALRTMLAPLGLDLRVADGHGLQGLIDAAKGTPQAVAVNMMVLRSLMKARYDRENLGHFGLAAPYYCHFTSPIRRYPDLVVHRSLSASLTNDSTALARLNNFTAKAALQSSERELAAQSAEREIEKLYMAEFMLAHVGEEFHGVVSGSTKYSVFVTLENGIEGMAVLEGGQEDYPLGAPLTVVCLAADPGSGIITLGLPGDALRPAQSREKEQQERRVKKALTPKSKGGHKPAPRHKRRGKRG